MGRLDGALSPYLLSHAHQSVDWYPWGLEAFAAAEAANKPVMISIGYSTCHWCHVMSRESFDNPDIAAVLNERVISIKVDREEHPEVDALYMNQARAFTEQLGWPLTVFTTPGGTAFYAQTYLPPEPRGELPSLPQVVEAVSRAWNEQREHVLESTRALSDALAEASGMLEKAGSEASVPSAEQLGAVVDFVAGQEDPQWGGVGGAPKFPVAPILSFLQGEALAGNATADGVLRRTLSAYAESPLRDPVEGGFFRYSTGADFSDPHYERMLYDNAGLLALYSDAGELEIAAGIVSFLRDVLLVQGGFGSAQDSESIIEGQPSEGGYYQRSASERSHLNPPRVDDKVITAWNGLALVSLARAHLAGVRGNPGQFGVEVATELCATHIRPDGSLLRLSRGGVAGEAPATLEDYGGLSWGLLELGIAMAVPDFITTAFRLLDSLEGRELSVGVDPVMAHHGVQPVMEIQEGASPSGVSMLAQALSIQAALTGKSGPLERAQALIAPHIGPAMASPVGSGGVLSVLGMWARSPRDVVVVSDEPTELHEVARTHRQPGTRVFSFTASEAAALLEVGVTLLEGRTEGASPVAYVCHGGVCELPARSAGELEEQLRQ
ncbi:MAG: hypothetical protein RL247_328 [Actinomycetota bacterium]